MTWEEISNNQIILLLAGVIIALIFTILFEIVKNIISYKLNKREVYNNNLLEFSNQINIVIGKHDYLIIPKKKEDVEDYIINLENYYNQARNIYDKHLVFLKYNTTRYNFDYALRIYVNRIKLKVNKITNSNYSKLYYKELSNLRFLISNLYLRTILVIVVRKLNNQNNKELEKIRKVFFESEHCIEMEILVNDILLEFESDKIELKDLDK